jgi:hypothetical protein
MDGQKFQRVRKMIEQRHDDELFAPFHNALKSTVTPSQVTEDEEPKKEKKKK